MVYLGVPGPDPNCPSALVGTTEALLIQPSAAGAAIRAMQNPVDRLITVITRRITVTATYGAHREQIDAILASASLPSPTVIAQRPDTGRGGVRIEGVRIEGVRIEGARPGASSGGPCPGRFR